MRLEDWQKWLDSQFVDEEEKSEPEPPRAVQETLLFDAPEEPAQAQMALPSQAILEQPITSLRAASPPEAAAPPMPEPVRQTPPASKALHPQSQEVSGSAADTSEEIEVPSIERYLPFLFGRQPEETPKAEGEAATEKEEPSAPEAVAPVVSDERSQVLEPVLEAVAEEIAAVEPLPGEMPAEMTPNPVMAAQESVVAPEPAVIPVEEKLAQAATSASAPAAEPTSPVRAEAAKKPTPKPENRRYGISRRRSRHARNVKPTEVVEEISAASLWGLVPRHIQTLIAIGAQTEVAQNSYKRQFKESRLEMIQRLLDPTLSLADTARLLNVCPTTVRRYTNRGLLTHQRQGKDRRSFKLSDVLAFLEAQSQARSKQP